MNVTKPRLKVKLSISHYKTKSGFGRKENFYHYKEPSSQHLWDLFIEDWCNHGSYCIENHPQPEGVYELIIINESKCWETGCVDDYDWKLVTWRD